MEALLGDLKRQMNDLTTAYPQPDHDGQFIIQQSKIAVKEDTEEDLTTAHPQPDHDGQSAKFTYSYSKPKPGQFIIHD